MERALLMQMMADPESRKVLTVDEMLDALQFAADDIGAILDRARAKSSNESSNEALNPTPIGAEEGT